MRGGVCLAAGVRESPSFRREGALMDRRTDSSATSKRTPRARRRTIGAGLSALAAVLSTIAGFAIVAAQRATAVAPPQTSAGTAFWLTFQGNLSQGSLFLFISGSTATSGTV